MSEPTDETLAKWLAEVTVTTDPPEVKKYQAALTHVLSKLAGTRALDLVAVAHGAGNDDAFEWVTGLIKQKKSDLVVGDNHALIARLASAAVVKSLASQGQAHVMLGLSVESAKFA